MKALSVRPAWAWMIVHLPGAGKSIENRTWQTKHRGPVVIHSSSTLTRADWLSACETALEAGAARSDLPSLATLERMRGGIVGAVRLLEVSRPGWCADGFDENDAWRQPECFGWHLADRVALPFRACPGSLGVRDMPLTPVELTTLAAAGLTP